MKSIQVIVVVLLLLCSGLGEAATWYVKTTGNDSNSGRNPLAPLLTISAAEDSATAGDVVYVYSGTYTQSATLTFDVDGTEASPIKWKAIGGWVTVSVAGTSYDIQVQGDYHEFYGLYFYNSSDNTDLFDDPAAIGLKFYNCRFYCGGTSSSSVNFAAASASDTLYSEFHKCVFYAGAYCINNANNANTTISCYYSSFYSDAQILSQVANNTSTFRDCVFEADYFVWADGDPDEMYFDNCMFDVTEMCGSGDTYDSFATYWNVRVSSSQYTNFEDDPEFTWSTTSTPVTYSLSSTSPVSGLAVGDPNHHIGAIQEYVFTIGTQE